MNCVAKITARGCLTGYSEPLLPRACRHNRGCRLERIPAISTTHEAENPKCDKCNSANQRQPKENLGSHGMPQNISKQRRQHSLNPRRDSLAKEFPSRRRGDTCKFPATEGLFKFRFDGCRSSSLFVGPLR